MARRGRRAAPGPRRPIPAPRPKARPPQRPAPRPWRARFSRVAQGKRGGRWKMARSTTDTFTLPSSAAPDTSSATSCAASFTGSVRRTTEEARSYTGTLAHADPSWTLDLLQPGVVHGGTMKCRHKSSTLQTHHELLPARNGVMRCIAQPLRGSTTTKRASDSTNTKTPLSASHPHPPTQAPCTPALAHTFPLDTDLTRNTRAPYFTPQHCLLCHMGLY